MKKIISILLSLLMAVVLFSCGEDTDTSKDDSEKDSDTGSSLSDKINEEIEDAEDIKAFSEAAVERYLNKSVNMKIDDIKPDWDYTVGEYGAYADDPSSGYGHAVIKFVKAEGELTDDEYDAWLNKVFAATAQASQDGYNIIGYEFAADGENALSEVALEDAISGFMSGWAFRYNDKIMVVYVSNEYDRDKDSEIGALLYYNGVKFDVGVGLQKSFDDTMADAEQYFEENEDEIKDAIEDYLN